MTAANRLYLVLSLLCSFMVHSDAFAPVLPSSLYRSSAATRQNAAPIMMAGFGAPKKGGKPKEIKLKPKQQWDRYTNLKSETIVKVAVRTSQEAEWLEVGRVKSKGNEYTEIAVAKQRVIIAEHSRRLFPLQILQNTKVEWGYFVTESEEWKVVDKVVVENAPDGIEKMIGFEGRPDPSSGFYCHYNMGRLVDKNFQDQL
eukprot:CAMPEP_0202462186 /NCGR_PEP_ID=MMETSP1360-20130828/52875_1 /ASSEMBLY_ACC=CAM_ASM_000848 /TAXON_ID=515479 /ORGANISM="Licmophora paradoxa, Strain CCMP2313" /LENGTH=199 /DNA_ID=CAMNT_0049084539 /DNA_START=20 /DNA_END=619 /DNA_ORIENTATION=-